MGVYLGQSVYNDSQVTIENVEELIAQNGKGVFWAIYDVTTFEEIETAFNDGKTIICIYEEYENVYYYGLLEHFNSVGESAIFTALDYSKQLKQWSLIGDTWYYVTNPILPDVTSADNDKYLVVKDGSWSKELLPTKNFGAESPLKLNETTNEIELLFDRTGGSGMFLFCNPSNLGGGIIWKYSAEEIEVIYDTNTSQWKMDGKVYTDIVSAINYCRTVYVKLHANTNDFYYMPLMRLYDDNNTWKAIFTRCSILIDTGNQKYVVNLDVVTIDSNNNVTLTSHYSGESV